MTRIPGMLMIEQLSLFEAVEPPKTESFVVPVTNGRSPRHEPKGSIYDLERFFKVINRVVFKNCLDPCVMRWSRNRWHLTLGLCDVKKRVITLNTCLDDTRVPDVVVAQVLHHEMLHLYFGISEGPNGTRRIHTPQFRAAEKMFPGYKESETWIEQNWPLRGRPAKRGKDLEHKFLAYLTMMAT
jgi:hypothetical protein